MKAIQIKEYGNSNVLVLTETEIPKPKSNEVLIRIKASGINPIDTKIRSGAMSTQMKIMLPATIGWEAAGVIKALGNDVQGFSIGDEVYTMPNFMQGGTYAEYVAVNASEVALKPKTINFSKAAAIPMAAGAAYTALIKTANIQEGQKVLIHGAAGSVGSFAVQIAKAKGAEVYGTASGKGLQLLNDYQTDVCIDYTTTDFADVAKDMDIVLDLVGGETQMRSFGIMKQNGLLMSTVMPPSQEKAEEYGIKTIFIFTQPDADMLAQIAKWIDNGDIKVKEPQPMTLEQSQESHELIENRKTSGKLIFVI